MKKKMNGLKNKHQCERKLSAIDDTQGAAFFCPELFNLVESFVLSSASMKKQSHSL